VVKTNMGKKRKKSSAPPPPVQEAVVITESVAAAPEAPRSQPALSAEKAAELIAAADPTPTPTPAEPTPMIAISETTETPAVVETAPESETPMSETPFSSETPSVASSETPAVSGASAGPATARPKRKRKKRPTKPPVSREALDQKIGRLEAKLEEKKDAAAKAAREGFGSKPDEDDTSVPPVDLEVHDAFFAAGEKEHALTKESGSFAALDPRHAQKMSLAAHARRAHLSRYVKWSVGAAAAILMLGFAIKTFRGHPNEEPVRKDVAHTTQVAAQPVQETAQPKAETPPPAVIELKDEKTDDKKDDTALAGDAKAPEVAVTETNDKKEDMPPEKPKNAWQEKQAAKAALERGSNAVAIQAGERSVALDPSDGEAWLVLGGAYQAMGNASQAKRCYNACVSQGKKGPISDCKDVLGSM
jgi:tetratricopeptide (TPR) repeat protein